MKIVHISTSIHGGAGIAAYRLHQALMREEGITSSFLQKERVGSDAIDVYQCEPYYPLCYKVQKFLSITNDDRYNKEISKYPSNYELVSLPVAPFRIEDHPIVKDADIINLHWVGDFLNYPSFFKKIKKPIVWTLHDMNPFLGVFHYEGDVNRNQNGLLHIESTVAHEKQLWMNECDNVSIVCLAKWMEEKAVKSEMLKKYPCYLIPNSIKFSEYPLLDKQKSLAELNLTSQKKNILFVAHGIDIYRKGFDLLSQALDGLDHTSFNLISVGGGLDMNLNKNINHIRLGRISSAADLNKIYSACDVTIIPSREDNLPNVMLESFANGTPVISFANGGMAEHINTGQNGILINETTSDALKSGVNDFFNDKYRFDRGVIRKYAEETFSSEQQVDKYVELYKHILSK